MSYGVLSQTVDVTSQAAFAVSPDVTADFLPGRWRFTIDGAANDEISISFDGTTVHGYAKKGAMLNDLVLHVPHKKVWLKRGTAAGTLKVIVHADQDCD
jgi:hypothetical protein